MKVSLESINSVQTRIRVDFNESDVNSEFEKSYKDAKKNAHIQGFRPGKAPLHMIRKMSGDRVAAEVADRLIRHHLFNVISEKKLNPISAPVIEATELPKEGKEYSFSAVIDIMPEMKIEGYKGLALNYVTPPTVDEVVENEIKNILRNQAKTKNIEEGVKSAKGHLVTFNQKVIGPDGQDIDMMTAEGISIELGAKQIYPELEEALSDKAVNENIKVNIMLPKEFDETKLAGQKVDFDLTITSIQELIRPTVDDELAKDIGFESLDDLKEKLSSRAKFEIENSKQNQLEASILQQLNEKNNFEVPPAIVDQLIDSFIDSRQDLDTKVKEGMKKDEEARKEVREDAKLQARNTMILMEIIRLEDLKAEDVDIDAYFEKTFNLAGQGKPNTELIASLKQRFNEKDKGNLLLKKAIDLIIENSTIIETPNPS